MLQDAIAEEERRISELDRELRARGVDWGTMEGGGNRATVDSIDSEHDRTYIDR